MNQEKTTPAGANPGLSEHTVSLDPLMYVTFVQKPYGPFWWYIEFIGGWLGGLGASVFGLGASFASSRPLASRSAQVGPSSQASSIVSGRVGRFSSALLRE